MLVEGFLSFKISFKTEALRIYKKNRKGSVFLEKQELLLSCLQGVFSMDL